MGPDLESRVVAPVQQCYFWKETPEFLRHYELEHCHDKAAMTSFPAVLFFFPSLSASDVARCFVDVLINNLALWQEFCVDNSMDIKKSDQHHLGFGLEHPRLFESW